jgi:CheY-like chemotaxis protein
VRPDSNWGAHDEALTPAGDTGDEDIDPGPIRLVLVEPRPIQGAAVREMLERVDDFEVVASVRTTAEAADVSADEAPDILVVDVDLPDPAAVEATRQLRRQAPDSALVIIGRRADRRVPRAGNPRGCPTGAEGPRQPPSAGDPAARRKGHEQRGDRAAPPYQPPDRQEPPDGRDAHARRATSRTGGRGGNARGLALDHLKADLRAALQFARTESAIPTPYPSSTTTMACRIRGDRGPARSRRASAWRRS